LNGLLPTSELVVSAVSGLLSSSGAMAFAALLRSSVSRVLRIRDSCAKLLQDSTDPERDGGGQKNEAKSPQRASRTHVPSFISASLAPIIVAAKLAATSDEAIASMPLRKNQGTIGMIAPTADAQSVEKALRIADLGSLAGARRPLIGHFAPLAKRFRL
jgi:hypothetical protein